MGQCGLPPIGSPTKVVTGTKRVCIKIGRKEVCRNVPTTKIVENTEYKNKLKAYNQCVSNEINIAKRKAEDAIKEANKKGTDLARQIAEKAKKDAEAVIKSAKDAGKKIKKGLKDLVGKARSAYQKMLKKQILMATYLSIRGNAHGIATRLYPAITSDVILKNEKFKASFKPKSSSSYNEVLQEWTNLGGKKAKLDEAIRKGAKLRILKIKKKSSGFNGLVSNGFDLINGGNNLELQNSLSFVRNYEMPFPNSEYSGCCGGYSGADGDGDGYDDESGLPKETWESDGVTDETVTSEEETALKEEGVEEVSTEEKTSAWKNIIAKILSIFRKNKADESPYEEGSPESETYNNDIENDAPYQPELDEFGVEILKEASGDSESGDSESVKVFGKEVPKTALIVGGVLTFGLLVLGGVLIYKKYNK